MVGPAPHGVQKPTKTSRPKPRRPESIDEFLWNIASISAYFEEISFVWARMLGVNVHQWMILMALKDLDRGEGMSVNGVSAKIHMDASFVTTQSKSLEKLGYLRRVPSPEDARVVLMSLTDKASKDVSVVMSKQDPTKRAIFSELDGNCLDEINGKLSILRETFHRTAKRLLAEI